VTTSAVGLRLVVVPGAALVRRPLAVVVLLLGVLAAGLGVAEVLWSGTSARVAPAVLAAASLASCPLLLRRSDRLEHRAAVPWRAFALIVGLLGLGQGVSAVTGGGVNAPAAGPEDVPMLAVLPIALWACAAVLRGGGRIGPRVALDAAVALTALGMLLEFLLDRTPLSTEHPADALLVLGYPTFCALLCAIGLVTLAGIGEPRRVAVGWLLGCFAAVTVVSVCCSLSASGSSVTLDVLTSTAWLVMLATGLLASAADPGQSAPDQAPPTAVPLLGVVVTYCVAFGAVLVPLVGRVVGRSLTPVEAVAASLLLALTFARTLVWAADGTRLTRDVLRTEAYFRTLVHSSADLTIVLDDRGQVTWTSDTGSDPWTARDLPGTSLYEHVHEEDRAQLLAVLAGAESEDTRGRTFRFRTRDGGWRRLEAVRVVPSGALHAGPGEPAVGGSPSPAAGLVLHLRDVDDRRQSELELERMAYTDYLTGLPNRARLMASLAGARGRAAEGDQSCLLLLDLDGFKAVNDVAGHEAGDLVLIEVADRLRATVRDRDLVGRLGGDEFAVVVRAGLTEATALAERILAELVGVHRSVPTSGADPDLVFDVSCSIGVTELHPAEDVPTTIRHADLALRAAKAAGKGCVRRHGETADTATRRRLRLARDLPEALSRGQLRLVYQPVVGMAERRVLGVEALVRWDHPELGEVPPEEFVPLAEDDGLIVPLQRWVLERSTAELAGWLAQGRDLQLGVNISVRHLQSGSLVPDVAAALARAGLPPRRLMLEVTESLFIGEPDRADGDLQTLHDLGCVISLDDFGRGYSTFAHLSRLPVDVLKMDREFLAGISDDQRSAALVHSVIELGNRLSIDVVAEGVETAGQLAALRELGCRYLQGFLLGRPVRPEELLAAVDAFDPALLDGSAAALAGVVPASE